LVAVQDVRGRGDSEGEFRGFAGEAADGATAVRWARNLEGANGRVGTYGFSYQGLTQLLNAGREEGSLEAEASAGAGSDRRDDPFPDCLAPAMAGLDERLHWASEGGAHWWGLGLAWALQLAAEGCRRRDDRLGWRAIRSSLASGAFLEEGPGLLERHDPAGMGLAWLRCDPADPQPWRTHRLDPALLRRPMLLIGGWHDPHLRGVLDLWHQARAAGGRPGLVVGAWTHLDWRGGIDALQLAFFRQQLKPNPGAAQAAAGVCLSPPAGSPRSGSPLAGAEPDLAAGLATTLLGGIALALGSDRFEAFATAPDAAQPPGLGGEPWGLWSDGRAAIRSDEGRLGLRPQAERPEAALGALEPAIPSNPSRPVTLVHDPWRPLPARGGHLGLPPGSVDRADLDSRSDVACFTTAPWCASMRLLGRPCLLLPVQADQPGFDLCVALSLLPAGSLEVRQLSTGFGRFLGAAALGREQRRVELQPLAVVLDRGDRLRLSIGAAAWPAIAVNPGDGSMPWGDSGPTHRVISLELDPEAGWLQWEPLLQAERLG
jgi:predicted acyl esterase